MSWITGYQVWLSESQSLQNAQMVANHFISKGWTKEAISALCGNMRHESSINPDMYEYGYDWSADRGYGLVQWTPRSKYWDWAVAQGLDPRHGDSQLDRIDYEVDNNIQWIPRSDYGNMTFAQFRQNSGGWSVDYLTEAFTWSYERPNESAGWNSMPDRKAFAQRCFNELDFSGAGQTYNFIYPSDCRNITSPFDDPTRTDHYGVDFACAGTWEIYASAAGTVTRSDYSSSYGEVIYILHNINGQEYETVYAHLQTGSRTVSLGDTVSQGQVIGIMGNTGDSSGQHLHFELHVGRWNDAKSNAVDPIPYLGQSNGGGDPTPTVDKQKEYIHLLLSDAVNGWKF